MTSTPSGPLYLGHESLEWTECHSTCLPSVGERGRVRYSDLSPSFDSARWFPLLPPIIVFPPLSHEHTASEQRTLWAAASLLGPQGLSLGPLDHLHHTQNILHRVHVQFDIHKIPRFGVLVRSDSMPFERRSEAIECGGEARRCLLEGRGKSGLYLRLLSVMCPLD